MGNERQHKLIRSASRCLGLRQGGPQEVRMISLLSLGVAFEAEMRRNSFGSDPLSEKATPRIRTFQGLGGRFGGAVFCLLVCGAAGAQTPGSGQADCTNSLFSNSALCRGAGNSGTTDSSLGDGTTQAATSRVDTSTRSSDPQPVYRDQAGSDDRTRTTLQSQVDQLFPLDPVTDFQRLVRASTGEALPIFGRDLFRNVPSTFAPADQIAATADYVVGAGDELLIRLSGPESLNAQLTVDTSGSVYIPRVGAIRVAGLRYDELQKAIQAEIGRVFRNFDLSVSLGHLRSIQVYVVGEARRPGAYTISSLSTVLNALFVSGGPNVQGSLRNIQIRRQGQPTVGFDLYDLVLRGDKSKDVRLQQGDTIFIPSAGAQAAVSGSVRHPAIYELRGETSVQQLLAIAGGYTPTASTAKISVERIDADNARRAFTVGTGAESRDLLLRDGDVLFVNHITQGYEQSVTIRGNLANPGRFAWHEGMRLSEIIPDRMSLLTSDYWEDRNRLGVPEPLFEPLSQADRARFAGQPVTRQNAADEQANSQAMRAQASALALQSSQLPSNSASQFLGNGSQTAAAGGLDAIYSNATGLPVTNGQSANGLYANGLADPTNSSGAGLPLTSGLADTARQNGLPYPPIQQKVQIPAPEIDWSYAVIERLDKNTLQSTLVPFNLGRLVQDHDAAQDLALQPGDVVTILSQADIPVSIDQQTKFVRLEGEVTSAGVYSVRPGETLRDVLREAGGLTGKAYLYGSSFLRESARVFQQQRLNEYISQLSTDMERSTAVRAASSGSGVLDPNSLAEQRVLIAQLRQARATGRVVLEFQPASAGIDAVPDIPLENGDVFRIPSRPNTVSVIGAVYGQNIFLYDHERRVEDYVALAGKANRIADRRHAFIIRADGSIYSRERAQGIWTNTFSNARINPGDAIVIPEKLIKPTVLRELLDYSQILSSFGLAAAAINVVR